MARRPGNNFSKVRILKEDSPHFSYSEDEVRLMLEFCEQRLHQRISGIGASYDNLSLYMTRHAGRSYFAYGHIRAFSKAVSAAVGERSEDESPELRLVARLNNLAGRDVKTGAEIRQIRLQQAKGEV